MVGVVTYHGAHANKIETLKKSWMKDYLLGKSVFVISGTRYVLLYHLLLV